MVAYNEKWIDYYTPSEKAEYRIFCIPFAGGGASKYVQWKGLVPTGVEIVPIQLPGRERRVREPFEYDLLNMAKHIADTIEKMSMDGVPFSVFGHSMGGIIAAETVHILEKRNIKPVRCFISATDLNGISSLKSISEMDDDELLDLVSAYGAAQDLQSMKRFPKYFNLFMRVIRADFIMLERYKMSITEKLSIPMTAIYSDDDKLANRETMMFWKSMTIADFSIVNFPGGHFFLFDDSSSLIELLITDYKGVDE